MTAESFPDADKTSSALPVHAAIIMDGNRRWAVERGLPSSVGHKRGLEAAKDVVRRASELGMQYLTLYAFSTENWKRTAEEVGFLMNLVMVHLRDELDFYKKKGIRVQYMGTKEGLPADVAKEISDVCAITAGYTGLTVNLALNYGGRDEIVRAVKKMSADDIASLTEEGFQSFLDIPDLPPVDLMIRTGGEMRISNFLLWQAAYAELYFSDSLWPDWNGGRLDEALDEFRRRERRFGGS